MTGRARRRVPAGPKPIVRASERGVVALEFALALPLVALLVVGVLSLVAVVRTTLVVQEAARVGARLAAVHADDAPVVRGVVAVAGPDAVVQVGPRRVGEVVTVDVRVQQELLGAERSVAGRAAAMVEPVVRP